jgi:hypothetical protein
MSCYVLASSDYSAFRSIFRRRLSLRRVVLGIWLVGSISFGLAGIIADQLYLYAWPSHPERLELAVRIFPFERQISIGTGYFYVLGNQPSLKALHEVRKALEWDNGAADLIQAEMVYSFAMGKTDEAVAAFYRLKRIDPDAPAIKRIERSDEP